MSKRASTETFDWDPWIPPHPLPDTGAKVFKAGQVWACHRLDTMPQVFRVCADDGGSWPDVLAGGGSGDDSGRYCVLVQDVGEIYPRLPEKLWSAPAPIRGDFLFQLSAPHVWRLAVTDHHDANMATATKPAIRPYAGAQARFWGATPCRHCGEHWPIMSGGLCAVCELGDARAEIDRLKQKLARRARRKARP